MGRRPTRLSVARCPRLEDAVLVSHCMHPAPHRGRRDGVPVSRRGGRNPPRIQVGRNPPRVCPRAADLVASTRATGRTAQQFRVAVLDAADEHRSNRRRLPRRPTRTRRTRIRQIRRRLLRRPHSTSTDTTRTGLIPAPHGAGIRPPTVVEMSRKIILRGGRGQINAPARDFDGSLLPSRFVGRQDCLPMEASFVH